MVRIEKQAPIDAQEELQRQEEDTKIRSDLLNNPGNLEWVDKTRVIGAISEYVKQQSNTIGDDEVKEQIQNSLTSIKNNISTWELTIEQAKDISNIFITINTDLSTEAGKWKDIDKKTREANLLTNLKALKEKTEQREAEIHDRFAKNANKANETKNYNNGEQETVRVNAEETMNLALENWPPSDNIA